MRMADRDGIWSRGGAPVEELPDPFELDGHYHDVQPELPLPKPRPRRRRWVIGLYLFSGLFAITLHSGVTSASSM